MQDLDQMLWQVSIKLPSSPSQLQGPRASLNEYPANSCNSEDNCSPACGDLVSKSGFGLRDYYDHTPIRLLHARHDGDTLGELQASLLPGDV